jgi:hypothetical protein
MKPALLALLCAWPDAGVTPVRWVQVCEVKSLIIEHPYDPTELLYHGHFECPDAGPCQLVGDLSWSEDAGPQKQCRLEHVQ